jgi:glycogen operon protein
VGPGGYQVGGFPPGWAEWNDKYRDNLRDYWRNQDGSAREFAARFTGSGDVYDLRGRRPWAGVNFITAHDGFPLNDLVSYNDKHNEANGEDNKDGHNDNRSSNYGAEGPTDDPAINEIREQQKRNFLATLLSSHGTPMLLAGDEFGRSQMGNNNGFCQDSEISWVDWEGMPESGAALTEFVRKLTALRRAQPLLRRENWRDMMSVTWLNPGGGEQNEEQWADAGATTLGLRLSRDDLKDQEGVFWQILLLFNPHHGAVAFSLPEKVGGGQWKPELDTAPGLAPAIEEDGAILLPPRTLMLLV